MFSTAAGKPAALLESEQRHRNAASFATRKVWLPKFLYNLLPYFYLTSGIAALSATLYISEWFWVLPHYLVFSAACIHLGLFVYRRRNKADPDNLSLPETKRS